MSMLIVSDLFAITHVCSFSLTSKMSISGSECVSTISQSAGMKVSFIARTFSDETIVLVDTYGNPCEVNRVNLLSNAKERFQEQMNAWLSEYNEVNRER